MTETRIVTCPQCRFQFIEEMAGNVRTRRINATNWLAQCLNEVAVAQDCPSLQAEADGVSAPEPSQAPG